MNTLSKVPHKLMAPATLLMIAATILHSLKLCASASGETPSTPFEKFMTFYFSIENPVISDAILYHFEFCPHTDICNISFGFEENEHGSSFCGKCRCDVDCRRECCPDFVADLDQLAVADGNELECQYPVLQTSQQSIHNLLCPPQRSGYYFITDCPPGYGMEMKKACRRLDNDDVISDEFDISNVTPVTDIRSQLNYWNAFCASCHGIVKENLLAWNVSLNCKDILISEFSLMKNNMHMRNPKECSITFQPPEPYTPEKCTPLISRCNQAGAWSTYYDDFERLCHSPLGSSFNSTYKNVFCMICNDIQRILVTEASISDMLEPPSQVHELPESTHSLNDSVFDPYLMKFRQLYCSRTKTPTNGICVNNNAFNKLGGVFFEIEITFFPLEKCPVSLGSEVAKKIGTWFHSLLPYLGDSKYDICNRDTVYKINRFNTVVKYNYIARDSQESDSIVTFISSKWRLKLTRFHMLNPIYEMILNIANATVIFQLENNVNITLSPRLTRVYDIADLSDGPLPIIFPANLSDPPLTNPSDFGTDDQSEGTGGIILPQNESGLSSNVYDEDYIPDYSSDTSDLESKTDACLISKSYITLFLSDLIPCTMVELDEHLFNWSYTEYGIYVPKLNLSLNMTDFNVVNDCQGRRLRICTHVYMPPQAETFEADTILSILCTFMSIICILLTLIVYIAFPELRTVPGQINMLLVINLFMAQVMYIVYEFTPTSTGSICKGVGVLLHFFWLSAILWMHVCTFHMFTKFVKQSKPQQKITSSKTVIIYTVIVIVSSLIFVLTNIIKALVESDMVEMGYGSHKCYISSRKMVLFTFALPVGFVVLSNLLMFCVVIYKLRSLPHVEMNVKHRRNNVLILVKLSSLTGVTWIFGFLYIWTEEIILSYFFIVLNASIGIFIMASFTLNKRVINLIRSKFSIKTHRKL